MINGLSIKIKIAKIFEMLKINDNMLKKLNKKYKNNYIRVINYHETYANNILNFEKHLKYYSANFKNVDYNDLINFLKCNLRFKEKPGLIITFDDGFAGNFINALPLLEKYNFTGWFFISAGLINDEDKYYMNIEQIKYLIKKNHIIGCHTYTHHRMDTLDKQKTLEHEIIESKKYLEKITGIPIDIFCWVGGEINTYTTEAAKMIINAGYEYSFLTNSFPVVNKTNPFQIQRTNVEDCWDLSLIKFQISGTIDKLYRKKRKQVNEIISNII